MLGKLLDRRYQVLQVLSAGGFGRTYIAEDTRRPGNPQCVVKHLTPASNEPNYLETARRLFISEAETLEQLGNHDQIPRLLAYFEEHQEFYLVQEFIVGHSLSVELQPNNYWSESQVIQLLQDVLGILAFVHSYGVIHRDIKPDNLIRRASDGKLVLIDFGAVKQVRTQILSDHSQMGATVAIGTPGYMASEQGLGQTASQ
jgi:serine/threonine-protein kinase